MSEAALIFSTYAESADQLYDVRRMAESIRTFGGKFGNSPIWAYLPQDVTSDDAELVKDLQSLEVVLSTCILLPIN
ncbi:MAG: hypothetical protein CVT49_09670 [candidate division Zixibacteria bacterium HGW-Zixibacteria-1]|nr:MAG: hypothetical protein CVT49_09670 [candidate division Zixibacteria bacterium HGW-Zixibacteria-1]